MADTSCSASVIADDDVKRCPPSPSTQEPMTALTTDEMARRGNEARVRETREIVTLSAEAELSQYAAGESANISAVLSLAASAETMTDGDDMSSARAPISLSAVIDKSGSMAGQKLRLVRCTTQFMAKQLSARDMMGLIAYDDEVDTVMRISSMTPFNKQSATAKIQTIHAGATTNLSGGLLKGLEQQASVAGWASNPSSSDGPHHGPSCSAGLQAVFLLTDGLPNVGITSPTALSNIIKSANASLPEGQAVRVHTFGFGSDVDPVLLGQLAEAGGGTYYYIESEDQVPAVFGEALGGLLSTTCQNVEVVIKPQPGVLLKAVRADFRQEEQADGSVVIHLGDLCAEEQKDLLLELQAGPCTDELSPDDPKQTLASFIVTYFDVSKGQAQEARGTLQVKRPETVDPNDQRMSEMVRFHKARVQTSRALEEARLSADQGDLAGGRLRLESVLGKLKSLKTDSLAFANLFTSLEEDVESTVSVWTNKASYERQGKKRAMMLSREHGRQRSQGLYDGKSACLYSNQMQSMVSMRARDEVCPSAKRRSPPPSAPVSSGLTKSLSEKLCLFSNGAQ